jgi:APA family basic amino acid/polyamine antiporter
MELKGQETMARIGMLDAVSMIVGIIVGVGIFETPAKIFEATSGPVEALLVWALGGLLALVGALCFAELASTYPRSGGEYVYLSRAFGPWMGFLYAWAQFTVIRPGNIALVAYVFSLYAFRLWGGGPNHPAVAPAAALVVAALTVINILGVALGKGMQNLLTLAKVIGLAALVLAGFLWGKPSETVTGPLPERHSNFALAMILALWTYAGWHEGAYIAAEVKEPRRNVPLSLLLGTLTVTIMYLLVNAAFLVSLGFDRLQGAGNNVNVLELFRGYGLRTVVGVLILISALGATNGMIFTTARIYAAFAEDHRLFAPLGRWSRRWGTPVHALIAQAVISLAFILLIGLVWHRRDAFNTLVDCTAGVFWFFFLMTGIGLFILRRRDRQLPRPFRVPGYPVLPIIFCAWCAYLMIGSVVTGWEALMGLVLLIFGWPVFYLTRQYPQKKHPEGRKSQGG